MSAWTVKDADGASMRTFVNKRDAVEWMERETARLVPLEFRNARLPLSVEQEPE